MQDPPSFSARQILGRYELLAPIARGGMGQVWVGRLLGARGFQKLVAIKTLAPQLSDTGQRELMLAEEARLASSIQHPNVVQTIELGEQGSTLYLVMEWVDGESLSYLLKRAAQTEPLPLAAAVNFVAQACRGLHAAHELTGDDGELLGVVHRDVSPHNLLVTHSGICKVADFGIAKAMNAESSASTQTGEIKGKFAYMAPEQILGDRVDRRADVFALGIVLYALTVGRHPFKNHDSAGVVHAITSADPVPAPSSFLPYYPARLEAVMMKALEKDPDKRWPSTDAMNRALQIALPEAFGSEMEGEIRRYLAEVMGDRALARREALRRMLLEADRERLDSGQQPAIVSSAQSAGSLRAISVDSEAEPQPSPARTGDALPPIVGPEHPTFVPPPPRASHSRAWIAAGLIAIGLAGGAVHFWQKPNLVTPRAATAPVQAPTLAAVTPTAAVPVLTASTAVAAPEPAAPAAKPAGTAPAQSAARPTHAPAKPAKRGKSDDLISPY